MLVIQVLVCCLEFMARAVVLKCVCLYGHNPYKIPVHAISARNFRGQGIQRNMLLIVLPFPFMYGGE